MYTLLYKNRATSHEFFKFSSMRLPFDVRHILFANAEQHGVEQNFFFLITFKRYQVQLQILNDLEKTIKQDGILVTKEYVKGRKNVYSHPAISDYNRTTDSANKTVVTLVKIITTLRDRQDDDEPDPLLEILSGRVTSTGNLRTENGAKKKIYDSQQSENASAEPHFEKENSTR